MARQETFNNSNRSFNNQAALDSGIIFKVEHVRDWGRNDGITFSLRIEGPITAEIYGCRIKSSRNGEFVAFPQRKGRDGQYYKHAWMQLSDDQTDEIISAVYDALESA